LGSLLLKSTIAQFTDLKPFSSIKQIKLQCI